MATRACMYNVRQASHADLTPASNCSLHLMKVAKDKQRYWWASLPWLTTSGQEISKVHCFLFLSNVLVSCYEQRLRLSFNQLTALEGLPGLAALEAPVQLYI